MLCLKEEEHFTSEVSFQLGIDFILTSVLFLERSLLGNLTSKNGIFTRISVAVCRGYACWLGACSYKSLQLCCWQQKSDISAQFCRIACLVYGRLLKKYVCEGECSVLYKSQVMSNPASQAFKMLLCSCHLTVPACNLYCYIR